ncbi:hypothetical protein LTR64_000306 [Lithohypha guttulata]|uniref:uncharacterized protein n=1 Tax=Lithohypha guttulata TaxID=1690604 RepID=UPI002DE097F2|nr:hypothetical protein LTR51_007666 [Lithohypha guttulata]
MSDLDNEVEVSTQAPVTKDSEDNSVACPGTSHGTLVQPPLMTAWQRELAASRVGRHSRASSIISTRTRLTVQSDDARSVEIEAGGQTFRISRDGSSVSNTTAPPPYPGPPLPELVEESDEDELTEQIRPSLDTVRGGETGDEVIAESAENDLPLKTHQSTNDHRGDTSPSSCRKPSGFESLHRLKSMISGRWYGSELSDSTLLTTSTNDLMQTTRTNSASSSRDNDSLEDQDGLVLPILDAERRMQEASLSTAPSLSGVEDEPAAEIGRYYHNLIRDMDREHRKKLHERDVELAQFRELLNNQDVVYRQQLRERDHTIESLKSQVSSANTHMEGLWKKYLEVEEEVEARLEKARNEVEDVWEKRWKEYEALLRRKMIGLCEELPRGKAISSTSESCAIVELEALDYVHYEEVYQPEPASDAPSYH